MKKEEILKITGRIYDTAETEIIEALLRVEKIADETLYEGLLILDELRENMMAGEDFPAKEYLMMLMMWVCDGMEPDYIRDCMENMIEGEENKKTKVIAYLYLTGLRCIQLCEPSSPDVRQKYLASLFPIKEHEKLCGIMWDYTISKKRQRKIDRGINLLMLHYEVEGNEKLDKYLSEMPLNGFKQIFKKIKEDDVITMLLICSEELHTRLIGVMSEGFKEALKNFKCYARFIRKQQIKDAVNNWKQYSDLEG